MQKSVLIIFSLLFLFGIMLNSALVLADNDDSGREDSEKEKNNEDKSESSEISLAKNQERERDENKIRERIREETSTGKIEVEREIEVKDGKTKIKIKRKIENENGSVREETIVIERDEEGIKKRIKTEGGNVEVETELEIEDDLKSNQTNLRARLRDGNYTDIKILPDTASEIARLRLQAMNLTRIELREKIHNNIPQVVYQIESNKNGRFLGVFKLQMRVQAEINPETGDVLNTERPWWAFLVLESDAENTEDTSSSQTENTAQ